MRCYCAENEKDWDTNLAMLEFHYNNSCNASTNTTPFYANSGFHPRYSISRSIPNVLEAAHTVEKLETIRESVKTHLVKA